MSPRKGLARIAGFLWLVVGISGGFAQGFMEPKMYAAGNAAATAANVVANPGLVRLGVVAELVDSTVFIFLAMTLYILLKHVHKSVARAMVVLVALSTGVSCLNVVFEFEGLRVATDSAYAAALGLDRAAFARCVQERRFGPEVEADVAEAVALGVFGTPTLFVNGRRVEGLVPVAELRSMIADALKAPR